MEENGRTGSQAVCCHRNLRNILSLFCNRVKAGFPPTSLEETSRKDLIVHEVFDRRTSWGRKFLAVVNRGLSSVCYRDMKGKLDKILRKNAFLEQEDNDHHKSGTILSLIGGVEGKRTASDITHPSQDRSQSQAKKKRKKK